MNVVTMRYAPHRFRKNFSGLGSDFLHALQENRSIVLLALLFLAGMTAGCLYERQAQGDMLKKLDFLFAGNVQARISKPFYGVFIASFASAFLFLFACFLAGLSMWGPFVIPAVVLFRGFGFGITSGYLYSIYCWKGFFYYFLVFMPGGFLCSVVILTAAREGIRCSVKLLRNRKDLQSFHQFRGCLYHFGILLVLSFAASLLDSALSVVWSKAFVF